MNQEPIISISSKVTINGKSATISSIIATGCVAIDEDGKSHSLTFAEAEALISQG